MSRVFTQELRDWLRRRRALVALLSVVGSLGCAGQGPEAASVLESYGDALENGDYADAYSMMSESFRARHSKEDFVRMMRENRRQVRETAARVKGAASDVEVTAELTYGIGETMELVHESGRWRIVSNPMDFYSQGTPREALRSFLRAYELKRWQTLLRFVPNKYAERMNVETMRRQFEGERRQKTAERMKMIKANLDKEIEVRGHEARMRYGENFEVRFVREENAWKIQDID